jgi:hypothetical protein
LPFTAATAARERATLIDALIIQFVAAKFAVTLFAPVIVTVVVLEDPLASPLQ